MLDFKLDKYPHPSTEKLVETRQVGSRRRSTNRLQRRAHFVCDFDRSDITMAVWRPMEDMVDDATGGVPMSILSIIQLCCPDLLGSPGVFHTPRRHVQRM